MAESNETNSDAEEPESQDNAENIAGNPAAGARVPGAPLGEVPIPVGAAEQGGAPTEHPADAHSEATPAASAPPPPGPAAAAASDQTPEQRAKVEEMKAKIAALKAQKEGGAAAPAAPAAAPSAGGDADKEAKLAEMRAKIEAAKAGKGAAPSPAPAASAAPAAAAPAK